MLPLTTEKYRRFTIETCLDENPSSPREWDNLGTMVCFHRSYDLGDVGGPRREHNDLAFHNPEHFEEWLKDKPTVMLPLYLYDHSGLWMATGNSRWPFTCRWDSMQVGWIYATKEDIRREHSCQRVTKGVRRKVVVQLQAEVETYSAYISGQVFGWVTVSPNGESLDSCWGYYGPNKDSGLLVDARAAIDAHIKYAMVGRDRQIKGWIRNGVPLIYRTALVL